ncbi:MAG: AI-2E family transporter [Gemmataceae bacterium]|nr:AI-2E family transporter [Gemmataceae bacterium]
MSNDGKLQAGQLAILGATAVALYICWLMLQPFLDVLLWSVVVVIVFWPLQRHLVLRTGRPMLSAALSCLIVLATVLVPLGFIVLAVVNEVAGLTDNLPNDLNTLLDRVEPTLDQLRPYVDPYVINLDGMRSPEAFREHLQALVQTLSRQTLGLVGNMLGAMLKVVFILFTVFYLFQDGPRILDHLGQRLPLRPVQSTAIFRRTREVIDASVRGVLVIAVIQGVLAGLAFWVLGLPSPLLWTLVMTVLSTIPMAGSFLVWVPASLVLAIMGHWPEAIALAVWCVLVIGGIDNFLRPKLVGGKARLHELFIFFSVLGGLQVFGILGMVLGPVVLAITLALLEVLREVDPASLDTVLDTEGKDCANDGLPS